jgi:hypothetical protein
MRRAVFLGIALGISAAHPVTGQHLPGHQGPSSTELRSEWTVAMRAVAERTLQDLLNLARAEEWQELARFFTDRGLLVGADGRHAEGRDAILELLSTLPPRSGYEAQLFNVQAGTRLIHFTARARFTEGAEERTVNVSAVLENHRSRWMFRMLALSPVPDASSVGFGASALRPDGADVYAPALTRIRVVVEPLALRMQAAEEVHASHLSAGAGLGIELDRTLEARFFAWQDRGQATGEYLWYGGELRAFFRSGRYRPYLVGGLGRLAGAVLPDTSWVPTLGAGLAVQLRPNLDLHFSLRNSYLAVPDGHVAPDWMTEKRSRQSNFGVGVSLSAGPRRVWTDAERTPAQMAAESAALPYIGPVVGGWAMALVRGDSAALSSATPDHMPLFVAGDATPRAGPSAVAFLTGIDKPAAARVSDVRSSGAVAYAELELDHPRYSHALVVLERADDRWSMAAAVLR